MKQLKKIAALALATLLVISLTACSAVLDKFNSERMVALVQGNLD